MLCISKIIDQASANPTIFLVRIVRQHVIDADIISDILMTGNLFFALYIAKLNMLLLPLVTLGIFADTVSTRPWSTGA